MSYIANRLREDAQVAEREGHPIRAGRLKVAAIAMEAAKPARREAGSTRKGDSAGPKDIAQGTSP